MKKDSHSFKDYLLKLVDDALPEDEKKKNKKKGKKERDADLPTGILKYVQLSNAGDA
jgi:hypothetical protein